MRNRVKSYKKKSPIALLRDRFHSSALQFSGELSFARKNSWNFPKLRSLLSVFDFSRCDNLHPKMLALVTIVV